MHAALQLSLFWALAFVTLCSALVLLNIFDSIIGNDLVLHSLGKEAAIAGFTSLVEGGCFWAVVTFVPAASRALIVPAIIVALIYKIGHFEDWSKFDVFMLLGFQVAISFFAASLLGGHFQTAIIILVVFGAILAVIAGFMKNL